MLFAFSLSACSIFTCSAQNKLVDSLIAVIKVAPDDTNKLNLYSALTDELSDKDGTDYNQSCKILAEKLMKSKDPAIKRRAINGYANCISNEGHKFYFEGKSDSAVKCFTEALRIYRENGNLIQAASQLNSLASVHKKRGHLSLAIMNYFECLEIIEKFDQKIAIAVTLNNIAVLYGEVDEQDKALEYLEKSLKLKLESGYMNRIASTYNNIGKIYFDKGDTAKAMIYFEKAIVESEKSNEKSPQASARRFMGRALLLKNNYKEALGYFEKSIALYEEEGDVEGVSWLSIELSHLFFLQKDFQKAEAYALKGLELANKIGYPANIIAASLALKNIYKSTHKPAKALEMYEVYVHMRDSLATETTRKIVAKQEIEHEFEIKEAAAKLEQEKKDALALVESKKQKIIIWSIGSVLLLVVAFAFLAYRSFLRKRRDHIEITKQKELIEHKQKEILDSIHYAQRIQKALITSEKYIEKNLDKLTN